MLCSTDLQLNQRGLCRGWLCPSCWAHCAAGTGSLWLGWLCASRLHVGCCGTHSSGMNQYRLRVTVALINHSADSLGEMGELQPGRKGGWEVSLGTDTPGSASA
jgi:hypothetical protein